LQEVITRVEPTIAWFHGKVAWKQFRRLLSANDDSDDWGLQEVAIGGSRIFVSPNPSPANAAFSLGELVGWYNRLADCL
jgi:TDG/mug DNA glycosylase family protein